MDLIGKRALVCGGSQGIGAASAICLAERGANVILLARNEMKLKESLEELPLKNEQLHEYIAVDVLDRTALEEQVKQKLINGNIHILINNTGGPKAGAILDAGLDEFELGFQMHILTAQLLTKLLVPGMKEDDYGRIINVISTSVKEIIPGLGVSNTIRGAMGNWAKTMANELGRDGITVNNVLPGFTGTPRLDFIIESKMKKMGKERDVVVAEMKSYVPLQRFAEPREIGLGVAFLASTDAAYINGINLPIDGGRTKSL